MKKVLFPIVILLALGCTVGIYYLIFDLLNQPIDHLFYINVVSTCLAELLLLVNVPILSGEKLLNITNATVSLFTNIYAIAIFAWTLFFTLIIHNIEPESFRIYYIGTLLLSLAYIVLCGVATIGAHTAEKGVKEQQVKMESKRNVVQFVQATNLEILAALENDESEWKDEFVRLFKMVIDRLGSMPNEKLHGNPSIAQKVEDSLTEISTLCDTLATAEDAAAVKADLTNKVNRLNKYLTTIKTL